MSFDPKFYTALHGGSEGDADFYRALCKGASRVLELGCGDARLLIEIAEVAGDVVGIEQHPGMLELAAKRIKATNVDTVKLIAGDISEPTVDGLFDCILLPFTTAYCLPQDALMRCLTACRDLLSADGFIAMDVYPAEIFHDSDISFADFDELGEISVDDVVYRVDEQTIVYRDEQRIDVTYRHVPRLGDQNAVATYTITHHYLRLSEWRPLLKQAGFGHVEIYGGFDGRAPHEDCDRIIILASQHGASAP
ncbi:MAG: class I SAM-dependent methyltransferase [Bradymonadia bacterium]